MPQTCSICKRDDRAKIDKEMAYGKPLRDIAGRYGTSKSALERHRPHVLKAVTKAREASEVANADSVLAQLREMGERIKLVYDACDRYLRDPLDESRYDLGPRGHDIEVVYEVPSSDGERVERKRALLSTLLTQIAVGDPTFSVVSTNFKIADPRKLILETAETMGKWLDRIATLTGELLAAKTVVAVQNNTQVNVVEELPAAVREDIARVARLAQEGGADARDV